MKCAPGKLFFIVGLWLLALLCPNAPAQDVGTEVLPSRLVTLEILGAKIQEVEAATGVGEEAKNKLIEKALKLEPDPKRGRDIYLLCAECHGEEGEGVAEEYMPLIQGQHYPYLVRQFAWIASGKRRNADPEMVNQIKEFNPGDIAAIMDYTSRLSPVPQRLGAPGWKNPDFDKFVRIQPSKSLECCKM